MRILTVHNYYQKAGGEDKVFAAESAMLEAKGNQVERFSMHNDAVTGMSKVKLAQATIWNRDVYRELSDLIRDKGIEIVHFHNTFPLISPAAYKAAYDAGAAVVQTLHNFRFICPTAIFFRDGKVCEDCLGKTPPYPGVLHACYRDSRVQSAAVATMLSVHRLLGTYRKYVNRYITMTEFGRQKFIEAGMEPDQIIVKPHFLNNDPGVAPGPGDYMLFAGRLTPEKGVLTLLEAWKSIPDVPLKIAGTGPCEDEMRATIQQHNLNHVEMVGHLPFEETMALFQGARALIFPSEWYETFGMVALEAFATGIPVIAAHIGAVAEVVDHGRTGYHFNPGDADDLKQQVRSMWDNDMREMRQAVRREYEEKYTVDKNYEYTMAIYEDAIRRRKGVSSEV